VYHTFKALKTKNREKMGQKITKQVQQQKGPKKKGLAVGGF
jgi:hypothetical protein